LDLREYLLLAARNWLVLVASVLVGLVTAGVLVLTATPQYESRAQVLFTAQDAANGRDLAYAGTYLQSRIQTYKDLATSPTVLSPVIEELELDESPSDLAERTEIEVSQIKTVVGITVHDPSAKDAAATANAVADALLAAVTQLETDPTPTAETARVAGAVVGPAEEASDPSDPNAPLYLLAGLFAGLLVGSAVVAVRHVVRPRARS
jgi:capsular polysaccharide biosynthesis protein